MMKWLFSTGKKPPTKGAWTEMKGSRIWIGISLTWMEVRNYMRRIFKKDDLK